MQNVSALQVTDNESKAVQKTPNRVALVDIEAAIGHEFTFNAGEAALCLDPQTPLKGPLPSCAESMNVLTICLITMKNGFTVIGKSAPADPENYNPELGRKFAREDAIRQLWPLMGFALRDRLMAS